MAHLSRETRAVLVHATTGQELETITLPGGTVYTDLGGDLARYDEEIQEWAPTQLLDVEGCHYRVVAAHLEEGCLYCGRAAVEQDVPAVDDDETWETIRLAHAP